MPTAEGVAPLLMDTQLWFWAMENTAGKSPTAS